MSGAAGAPCKQMDFEQVRKVLPHRFPMILVDRVLEVLPGSRLVALKNVTGNEICFLGHFPEMAVLPGVLIIEAAAQVVILLCASGNSDRIAPVHAELHYLAHANMSFHTPIVPGDQMVIEASPVRHIASMVIAKVTVSVGQTVAARGELTVGRKPA